MSDPEIVARKGTALYEILEERNRLRAALEEIVEIGYNNRSHQAVHEIARAALVSPRPAMTEQEHNAYPKGRW